MISNNDGLKLEINNKKLSGKYPKYLEINILLMGHENQRGYNREVKNIFN